jgi:hypothetical protein
MAAVPVAAVARRAGTTLASVWPTADWGTGDAPLDLFTEESAHQFHHVVGNVPPGAAPLLLWQRGRQVADMFQTLCDRLGLDHFEGRSWRGFHHHACLVVLAYGFLLSEEAESDVEQRPALAAVN